MTLLATIKDLKAKYKTADNTDEFVIDKIATELNTPKILIKILYNILP